MDTASTVADYDMPIRTEETRRVVSSDDMDSFLLTCFDDNNTTNLHDASLNTQTTTHPECGGPRVARRTHKRVVSSDSDDFKLLDFDEEDYTIGNDHIGTFAGCVDAPEDTGRQMRAVSCDEEDFVLTDFTDSPKTVTVAGSQPSRFSWLADHGRDETPVQEHRYCEHEQSYGNVPTSMSTTFCEAIMFDEEPKFSPNDGLQMPVPCDLMRSNEVLDSAPPTKHDLIDNNDDDDDDLIRIPSIQFNEKTGTRWSSRNSKEIVISCVGKRKLAEAVSSGAQDIQRAQLCILEELKKMTLEKSKAVKPKDLIRESEITDKDVICERGGKSNRHSGTKKYRGVIEEFKPTYQDMTAKTDKTNLSRKIISMIQSKGGRFLKKDEETGQYFVLSKVETTKKVSQALREKKILKWVKE